MMMKILRRIVWLGRSTATIMGLAVMVAIVLGTATTAMAAVPGDPFKLGRNNTVNALTTLIRQGPGPALSLKVNAGQPPLAVNSTGKVTNLNVDQFDDKDSTAFLGKTEKAADSDQLDGADSTAFVSTGTNAFVRNEIYRLESGVNQGDVLADGTQVQRRACNNDDVLLSGGPANVNDTSDMIESYPSAGSGVNSWSARIDGNGVMDTFSVVVLCVNQTP